ncbi:peptidase S41 family protein [Colletotrichum sojae]|uniref:Peptidase S41 family protein n=1 Tax=Colletotrichum sojae TaxID=2175907 RepID=A0A8H6IQF5_9PEZI|nr:peptidase S41 family protein [Colletotrichum sojae]
MMSLASALVRVLPLVGLTVAAPAQSNLDLLRRQTSGSEACAELARVYDDARSQDTTHTAVVKPSTAYQCLRSIPVDVGRDAAFIDYIRPWLEFQSTVGILPEPPKEYLYPGVNIFGGLDNMTSALRNGTYESQMDFAVDLYRLINVKPRDGHLGYTPVLNTLISFETPALFISISEDGIKTPRVYLYTDYLKSQSHGYTPSEVSTFDSAKIVDYLQQRSVDNSRDQDPDAAYNEQLYSAALANVGEVPSATRYIHITLSDESELEFANGTKLTLTNTATITSNFSGIDSGDAVHRRFEVPGRNGRAENPVNATRGSFSPALDGYPEPDFVHRDRYVSGYLLPGDAFADTAVLAVNSFISQNGSRRASSLLDDPTEFIRVNTQLVEASRRQRRTKLIIDLQGNGGGLVANAMSLYATIFPRGGDEAHMNMRVRAHAMLDWIGSAAEAAGADLRDHPYPFGFLGFIDENLRNFTTWESFYGPEKLGGRGEEYTNVVQPREVAFAADGVPGIFRIPEPWFRPEDTVIVTDGHCASACAYVVGMMARELGVQVVAMGGRPIDAPMQAIGGTKGGPVVQLGPYQSIWPFLTGLTVPPEEIDMTPFVDPNPPLAGPPTSSWAVNSANVYLDDDLDGTPVQFRYEAANCKLYYTWDTLRNMTRLWEAVSRVKWDGARCVKGSTTNEDGTMGNSTVGYSDKVVSSFTWPAGPGDVAAPSGSSGDNGGGGGDEGDGEGASNDEDENAAGSLRASWGVLSVVTIATMALFI